MRLDFQVTIDQPNLPIHLLFDATSIIVTNPTGSPICVRFGAASFPDITDADLIIPAGKCGAYPVKGRDFGVVMVSPALASAGANARSNAFTRALVTLVDASEPLPSYGAYDFLSLSISEVRPFSVAAGAFTSTAIDLGGWGGALVFLSPDPTSGQGILTIEVSADQATWRTLGSWAFWPNIPATVTVPRVARYLRYSVALSGIAGEPVPSLLIAVRLTLAEIAQLVYTPTTTSLTKAYNIPSLTEVSSILCTVNTPAIDITLNTTSVGSGAGGQELIVETSASPTGPWQIASFREQNATAANATIYRSFGNLNLFTRVRILEISNTGPLIGTVQFSIRPAPDLSAVLQRISAALGDVGYGVNVEQDIYHTLRYIADTALIAVQNDILVGNTSLASIDTKTTQIPNIKTDTAQIIVGNANINTTLGLIKGDTANLLFYQPNLSNLPTIESDLATQNSNMFTDGNIIIVNQNVLPATWTVLTGAPLFTGSILSAQGCSNSVAAMGALQGASVVFAVGSATVNGAIFYIVSGTGQVQLIGPTMKYWSNRMRGYPLANQTIWILAQGAGSPLYVTGMIAYR